MGGFLQSNPKPIKDSVAFKRFILDEMGAITGGPDRNVAFPFQGEEKTPLEDILYTHLRCNLLHEGEMPTSVVFTKPQMKDGQVYNVLSLKDPLGFPEGWVGHLMQVVMNAPENRAPFPRDDAPGADEPGGSGGVREPDV